MASINVTNSHIRCGIIVQGVSGNDMHMPIYIYMYIFNQVTEIVVHKRA